MIGRLLKGALGVGVGYGIYKGTSYIADKLQESAAGYRIGPGVGFLAKAAGAMVGLPIAAGAGLSALNRGLGKRFGARKIYGLMGKTAVGVGSIAGQMAGAVARAPFLPLIDMAKIVASRGRGNLLTTMGRQGFRAGSRAIGYGMYGAVGLAAAGGLFSDRPQYPQSGAYMGQPTGNPPVPGWGRLTSAAAANILGISPTSPGNVAMGGQQIWDPSTMGKPRRAGFNHLETTGLVQGLHRNR
jgi:hypothetical protein